MEAPLPSTFRPVTAATAAPSPVDSSITHNVALDTDPPKPPLKLRLLCSYGGLIVPRPHDKALCYIGGDTRIIVVDHHTSFSDFNNHLSKNFLHNQPFSLKYQLPSEDLDSLISVTTDEDLENMVEEYERLNNAFGGVKPGRIRLFLFPISVSGVEQILIDTSSVKSEDWYLNHLNGGNASFSASDRGISQSSSINCLLGLDDEFTGKATTVVAEKDAQARLEVLKTGGNSGNTHSVPESPMLERTSFSDSPSSSPSVANLPPIRMHVEESPKFQQMSVASKLPIPQKQEYNRSFTASDVTAADSDLPIGSGGDGTTNSVISDDERLDHGGHSKVEQIQPQAQDQMHPQHKQTGTFDLHSSDSVSSEGSASNSLHMMGGDIYEEQIRSLSDAVELKIGNQNHSTKVQDPGYMIPGQYDQNHSQLHIPQQFIPACVVPITSYYPIYPLLQQHHHPQLDQPYPFYFNQPYNLPVQQPSYSECPPPTGAYDQAWDISHSKPEMANMVYRTSAAATPQLVQVPSSLHQAQYNQIPNPTPPVTPSSVINSMHGYEYANTTNAQMYCVPLPPQLAAQYESPEPGVKVEAPTANNIKQQVRTLQQ